MRHIQLLGGPGLNKYVKEKLNTEAPTKLSLALVGSKHAILKQKNVSLLPFPMIN